MMKAFFGNVDQVYLLSALTSQRMGLLSGPLDSHCVELASNHSRISVVLPVIRKSNTNEQIDTSNGRFAVEREFEYIELVS